MGRGSGRLLCVRHGLSHGHTHNGDVDGALEDDVKVLGHVALTKDVLSAGIVAVEADLTKSTEVAGMEPRLRERRNEETRRGEEETRRGEEERRRGEEERRRRGEEERRRGGDEERRRRGDEETRSRGVEERRRREDAAMRRTGKERKERIS